MGEGLAASYLLFERMPEKSIRFSSRTRQSRPLTTRAMSWRAARGFAIVRLDVSRLE
jgi:hypothetical protein